MSDAVSIIKKPNFHAIGFNYNDVHYEFSGWWMLYWTDNVAEHDKIYGNKEDFLSDPIFDGKTLSEIQNVITDVDYELEP